MQITPVPGPSLLTVLLNWRSAPMTLRAAEAALRAMEGIPGSLSIVDNDSQDGSFEALSHAAEDRGWTDGGRVRVLQSGRNGGFGAGNNHGILAGLPDGTRPDFVHILNSDAFPEPDALLALMRHLQAHPQTGFAGSRIVGEDGIPHQTAFRFPSIASDLEAAARIGPISRLLTDSIIALPLPQTSCSVDWLAGASLMMRTAVLERIGLFDERFFLYFEETDLCRRARRAGWQVDWVADSTVVHIGSASTGMKTWARMPGYWFDSRLHYFVKNHGRPYAAAATAAHLAGGLAWRLRRLVWPHPPLDPQHFLRDLGWHAACTLWRRSPPDVPRLSFPASARPAHQQSAPLRPALSEI